MEVRYGALMPDLVTLRDMLVENGACRVAMESTGIYWMSIWRLFACDFKLTLVNPYLIKKLSVRKSDVKDVLRIAQCLEKDMLRDSYVPCEDLQQMRQFSRRYMYLGKQTSR